MARTDADTVKAILQRDYDTKRSPSLTIAIATANAMVNRLVSCAAESDVVLSDEDLALIEGWLAAHFYCQSDKPYSSKGTEGASGSFHGQTAMYLESTLYGQTAVSLDYSGCLGIVSKGATQAGEVGGSWLGKSEPEQRTYRNRN